MIAIFRVDSSKDIGTGHVMRCLAVADELKKKSVTSYFICRNLPENIHATIISRGYKVHLLPLSHPYKPIYHSADYAGWLQTSQEEDAIDFIRQFKNFNPQQEKIIIVDHYALNSVWESHIKQHATLLIAIDDLVREHDVHIIIDQTLDRHTNEYNSCHSAKKILAGSDYALIRTQFYSARELSFNSCTPKDRMSIFISMGGFDNKNILLLILNSLKNNTPAWLDKITIILSNSSPNFQKIKQLINKELKDAELIKFIDNMPQFMLDYSLAIGAPGSTTWERAAMGIPTILIPIAENQNDVAKSYLAHKAGMVVHPNEISKNMILKLNDLKENYFEMRKSNYLIADGLGIRRVIQEFWPRKAKDGKDVSLRKATQKDIMLVYSWQCQPNTRRYARNPAIPTLDEHTSWMKSKLTDPQCYFYIINHDSVPSGVVRLDRLSSFCYEISIFIDEMKQNLAIAKQALLLINELHVEVDIYATVMKNNSASQALFESVNYKKISDTEFKLGKRLYE